MSQKEETRLQRRVVKELKRRGYFARKIHQGAYSGSGLPDLFIAKNGRSMWIEMKRPDGTVSKIQKHTIGKMREAGCDVAICVSYGDALRSARIYLGD